MNIKKVLFFAFAFLVLPSVAFGANTNNPTGLPNWVIPSAQPEILKPVVIADSQGNAALVSSSGSLETTASVVGEVTLDAASLSVMDDDGDTWEIRNDESGEVYLTGSSIDFATESTLNTVNTSINSTQNRTPVDSDGDTWEIRNDQSGEVYLTGSSIDFATESTLSRIENVLDTSGAEVILNTDNVGLLKPGDRVESRVHSANGDTIGQTGNALHIYATQPQRSIFDEGTGDTLQITSDGEAKVDANVNVESSNSIIKDDEGDTVNYRLSPSNGYTNVSVTPGDTASITFSSTAYRVSFNATGPSQYRYELNNNNATSSSMPVFEGQYIAKSNGAYDQITFYNDASNSNNLDVTVEAEF